MLLLAAIPLGNPKDASISLREAIVNAKFIAAEDSRKFTRLCHDLNVVYTAKVISFFEGNEVERIDELVGLMVGGEDLLVVTDAGMPGISDPGYRLVRAAVGKEIQVKVLPGPSAVTTALVLSGLPSDRFCFEGFPPRTSGARQKWFTDLSEEPRTIIFFEAPHRLLESLQDAVLGIGGERPAAVCREMTKTYEEIVRGTLSELVTWAAGKEILGELTVVVQGFDVSTRTIGTDDLVQMVLDREAAGATRKEAIALVVDETGISKRVVFDAMVSFKGSAKNSGL